MQSQGIPNPTPKRPPLGQIRRTTRRQVRSASRQSTMRPLFTDGRLPFLVQPGLADPDLVAWGKSNKSTVDRLLVKHGGILFRDFAVDGLEQFQAFIETVSGELLEYKYRSTPRKEVQGNVYTSTEYPADQDIPMHNENSYSRSWPLKVFFYCEQASEEGGMTPICDSHLIYQRVSPEIRDRFVDKGGVMYVRNYSKEADLPWAEVFQTDDRSQVEAFCRQTGIELTWKDGDRLQTRQVCQAVARHPKTGDMLWFNQAHLFHVTSLAPEMAEAMLEVFGEDGLPRNTYYGDGTPIETSVLDEIRAIYDQERVMFPWQNGDILMLDNMAVAHGRTPFKGARKIRVGMSETMSF